MTDYDYRDPDSYRADVRSRIMDAVDYIDSAIAPKRAKATQYYNGEPFGNEEQGRSQIVMTVVRDKILAMLPSILRMFTSSEEMVEYTANTEDKVEQAAQATDYANHIIWKDNPGFLIVHSWLKDGLARKVGIVRWHWTERDEVTESQFTGLDAGQVAVVEQSEGVEILEKTEVPSADPMFPATFDLSIRRTVKSGRVKIECVPPEGFLINRDASDIDSATYCGLRLRPTISDLVAMGYDEEEIKENAGSDFTTAYSNIEANARNPYASDPTTGTRGAVERVDYVESYIRIDKDGDGIAELRKVCSLGNAHYILADDIVDEAPLALFCPDPEPHIIFGQSIMDQVGDIQLITSNIVRNTLDSLAQCINPRTTVVEGQVNLDDVLNTEVGGVIRQRAPGMVAALDTPFVGQQAMPILAYIDEVGSKRTGVMPATQGLDPKVLQSTEKSAVTATVTGAQERTEMIGRFFAETGMKRLFRGILRLICKHQDQPRIVRLRGKYVTVDPRDWDADLDVQINVALGKGTDQDKIAALSLILQKQELIIQTLGIDNPLAGIEQYRNTLAQITALMGQKEVSRYFKAIDAEQLKADMAQKQPPPDPNMMLVQIEDKKANAKIANDQAELALKERDMMMKDARERENNRMDFLAKIADIEAKYNTQVRVSQIESEIDRDARAHEASISGITDMHATEADAATQRHNAMVQAQAASNGQAPQ